MKKDLHPKYYPNAKATCACGNTFTVGSTKPELRVEICHKCHPFFTGEERFIDAEGRVEKFKRKRKAAELRRKKATAEEKAEKVKEKEEKMRPRSLRELLQKT